MLTVYIQYIIIYAYFDAFLPFLVITSELLIYLFFCTYFFNFRIGFILFLYTLLYFTMGMSLNVIWGY